MNRMCYAPKTPHLTQKAAGCSPKGTGGDQQRSRNDFLEPSKLGKLNATRRQYDCRLKGSTTERPHPRRMQAHTRGRNARRRNQTSGLTTGGQDNPFAGTTPAVRFKNQETQGAKLPRSPYTADAAFTRPNTGVRWLQVVDGLHRPRTEHRGPAKSRHGQQGHARTPKGTTPET